MKIQKTSRFVSIVTKILYVFLLVILCAEAIGIVLLIVLPDSSSVKLGNITIISPVAFNGGASTKKMIPPLLGRVVAQLFALSILTLTHQIFKDISREYTPFLEKNFNRMKTIAILLLISSILEPFLFTGFGSLIPYLNFPNWPGYTSIIFAVIVYSFALIFQYGSALQQQSDETL